MPARASLVALGVVGGVAAALTRRWTADDAFISFRYARNLVEGHGLVFNVGERVEGYTNFLWTLLTAAGLAVGIDAEAFTHALGIACYAGLIALLGLWRRADMGWPIAALAAAAHPDLWTYATSGLESSLFALLCAAGVLCAIDAVSARGRAAAGLVLGLCVLTRPDGAIVLAVGALGAAALATPGFRARSSAALAVALPAAVLVGGQLGFRLAYYGELLPNTYYAKSAGLAWYAQGLFYLWFFAQRSWALLVALAVALYALRGAPPARRRQVIVLALAGAAYAWFVVRVGGDFMFARLLVPVIAPWLLAIERATVGSPRLQLGLGALVIAGCALTPMPDAEAMWARGIVDERTFPDPQRAQPGRAETVARYLEGLPVRVAFTGGDARLMYRARVPVAIESETGLTDRAIARAPLSQRGRVGHEKPASLDYLIRERGAHLVFRRRALSLLDVPERLPLVEVQLGDVRTWLLHWDPALMEALRGRGARVIDFERALDAEIARLPTLTDLEVRRLYDKLELFYFAHVDDEVRRAPFARRLR